MDPRGIGKWDMRNLSTTETAIWAMDNSEAGSEGRVSDPYLEVSVRLRPRIIFSETYSAGG